MKLIRLDGLKYVNIVAKSMLFPKINRDMSVIVWQRVRLQTANQIVNQLESNLERILK